MANEMIYQSIFQGEQIDARLTAVQSLQEALAAVEQAITAKYTKPASGIPKADLASGVQDSLDAADSAYQKPSTGIPASDLAQGVIPDVPTISTNIAADKTSDVKTASPKAVFNAIHPTVVTSQPAGGFAPNILYNLGELTGAVTFALAAEVSGIVNHYYWTFDTGATEPTITWPAGITSWVGGSAPTIAASKHYEISVLGGVGAFMEV